VADAVVDRRRHLPSELAARALARASGPGAERLRYDWWMVPRPHYAWGVAQAVSLASRLGHKGVTVAEFGVASGNGLLTLERHAAYYEARSGLTVDVVGFDAGVGLPPSTDYRDLLFVWSEGDFAMDEEALRARLTRADLVLGLVADTLPRFEPRFPVGFVAYDLDLYTSTLEALSFFAGEGWDRWLPRVALYMDDVSTQEWVGVRRALADWNEGHQDRKVGSNPLLRDGIFGRPDWAAKIYTALLFSHPDFNRELTAPGKRIPLQA
jgi:hypothetical protein